MDDLERSRNRETLAALFGGICALMAAMGVGRFAYTPILPLMQQQLTFSDAAAGALASVNYAGYLLGAMVTIFWSPPRGQITRLRLSLLVNIATTAGMGLTTDPWLWSALRFFSGFSSAGVFVLASGAVLEVLVRHHRLAWSGFLYAGVGGGIALTGLAVSPLEAVWGWQGSWLGLAAAALLLGLGTWRWLPRGGTTSDRPATSGAAPVAGRRLLSWLTAAYFLEGLGYVVTGTFLVAQVQRLPGLAGYGASAWVLVGLAAVPSCVLWARLARRAGYPTALTLAYGVQAAGIVLPVVWPSLIGIYSGAIFFGGTFMGIVTLTIGWGRTLLPQQSGRVIGLLTTAFGAGQILGPGAAGWMAERLDGFAIPLIAAALVVAAGGLLIPVGLWVETRKR